MGRMNIQIIASKKACPVPKDLIGFKNKKRAPAGRISGGRNLWPALSLRRGSRRFLKGGKNV